MSDLAVSYKRRFQKSAGDLTPEQVAQAEAMATRCRESNFKAGTER